MKTYKTTAADEAYFVGRVKHWLNVLSLGDWKVDVYLKKLDDCSAGCETWRDSHGAHIVLNTEFPNRPQRKWLDQVALHEVGHVLLYDLKQLVYSRVVTDSMADTTEHAIIRRLENALCGASASDLRLCATAVRAAPSLRRLARR